MPTSKSESKFLNSSKQLCLNTADDCGILLGIKFEKQLTSLNSFLGVDADYNDYNYDYDYGTEVPVEGDENVKGYLNTKRIFQSHCMNSMTIQVVEFSNGGYKIRKFFA